jgi:hypothetical protein
VDDTDQHLDPIADHALDQEPVGRVALGGDGLGHLGGRGPDRLGPVRPSRTAWASVLWSNRGATALSATGPPSSTAAAAASSGEPARRQLATGTP